MREAQVSRKTKETEISLHFRVDGAGKVNIDTGYPFLGHMLELFCVHGFFDLTLKAKADIEVDKHHLVEDVGICLGKAFSQALKDKKAINRYGWSMIPMDEVMVLSAVDISGRPFLAFNVKDGLKKEIEEPFTDFFRSLCNFGGITLHVNVLYGDGYHHVLEGIFKSLGIILDQATQFEERRKQVPSTKGRIEEV